MLQVLLRLAPDRPDNVGDSYNASFSTMEQIEEQEVKLERSLLRFSEYLIKLVDENNEISSFSVLKFHEPINKIVLPFQFKIETKFQICCRNPNLHIER